MMKEFYIQLIFIIIILNKSLIIFVQFIMQIVNKIMTIKIIKNILTNIRIKGRQNRIDQLE
jgi:hypothetical protein